ncbi:carboxypeptidase regulatory-like domain-containing protein [Ferruginibacter sp.]
MKILFGSILCFLFVNAHAQYKQPLRGTVTDQVLQKPLAHATVTLKETGKTVTTDEEGAFRFDALQVGLYHLTISHTGFKEAALENITVNAGKETVLTIALETAIVAETEVVIRSNSKKNKPLNDMSAVSARAFTVEETQKYAAAVNDPLRMAAAFPGVLAADDGNNSIIIRGNSPTGLLWKMEGMDIPNPNHFSSAGNSGGGISILSSQLLANSDFVTAAFASEYGNALSGVFDLKLRRGNNEKNEYTLQAGVLGLNAAAEGPFSKNYKGSYLINYRYSTLQLLNKVGILPDNASTNFQDLSYNIYLPTKKLGTFTILGFGGLSSDEAIAKYDSSKWENWDDRHPYSFTANTYFSGITHTISLGTNATLKSGIGMSYTKNSYDEDLIKSDYSRVKSYKENYINKKKTANTTLNYRFSNKLNLRTGVIVNLLDFNYYQRSAEHAGEPLQERINSKGNTSTGQLFAQLQYKPTDKLVLNAGLHYLHLALNNTSSVEPRMSLKYTLGNKSSVALGYGLHSQVQVMGVYLAQLEDGAGNVYSPNKNLGLNKAHHYVISYNYRLAKNVQLKTELYYQQLFNVPVSTKAGSTFSTLNIIDGYVLEPMVNKGKGKNYGAEISLERYLHNNAYLTLTNSFYQSKYTALDGIERNTRFNGNHITTLIAGKDFVNRHKHRTIGLNIKTIYAGGLRTTPIDYAASLAAGYGVYKDAEAFSIKNPAYFRTDIRVSIKWNKKYMTSTLSLDIQNITNRLNVYNQSYDETQNKIVTNYQTGLLPILNYKVEF